MTRKRNSYNIHHIMGQCNKGKYNVDIPENKILVDIDKHRALNTMFGNYQSPKEQLRVLLIEWIVPILAEDVKEKLIDILNIPDEQFYIDKLYKGMKKK